MSEIHLNSPDICSNVQLDSLAGQTQGVGSGPRDYFVLAETSQNCKKQLFEKAPLFEALSRSTGKAAGCQVRLVLLSLNSSFS